ncbi:MAG: hypothetical protein JXA66_04405, partial [Oligoflexia bacterium]|nr:hypothetical protein [Oligoflexia bacterium]
IVLGEIERSLIESPLAGKKVVVTAGATRAFIDPVRFISNSSSGRMGVEIVKQMWLRGAEVILVCNPEVTERFPESVYYTEAVMYVQSTEDVLNTVLGIFDQSDIYISVAALCDFRDSPLDKKIKRSAEGNSIKLAPAVDVFTEVARNKSKQLMIGFALETDDLELNAKTKLGAKKMDMVVANTIDAIGAESSSVILLDARGIRKYVRESDKSVIAAQIADEIEELVTEREKVNNENIQDQV